MKNFVISSVLVTFLTIVIVYSLEVISSVPVLCISALIAITMSAVHSRVLELKVSASVTTAMAAFFFSYMFIYPNGLWLVATASLFVLTLGCLVEIREEVQPKERKEYFQQSLALMLAEFVVLSCVIIYLAK